MATFRDKGAFERGYNWAIAELKKGMSVDSIEASIDGSIDYTDFDRGASQALHDIAHSSK